MELKISTIAEKYVFFPSIYVSEGTNFILSFYIYIYYQFVATDRRDTEELREVHVDLCQLLIFFFSGVYVDIISVSVSQNSRDLTSLDLNSAPRVFYC